MSATEELRRMLDERGVEHYDGIDMTYWLNDRRAYRARADEVSNGLILRLWCTTPEQAIAATLGSEVAGEEIVRCKDCKHRRRSWLGHEPNFVGNWWCSYTGGHEVEPDGFCAWGERKGDE